VVRAMSFRNEEFQSHSQELNFVLQLQCSWQFFGVLEIVVKGVQWTESSLDENEALSRYQVHHTNGYMSLCDLERLVFLGDSRMSGGYGLGPASKFN
jgi:hypothetical protein